MCVLIIVSIIIPCSGKVFFFWHKLWEKRWYHENIGLDIIHSYNFFRWCSISISNIFPKSLTFSHSHTLSVSGYFLVSVFFFLHVDNILHVSETILESRRAVCEAQQQMHGNMELMVNWKQFALDYGYWKSLAYVLWRELKSIHLLMVNRKPMAYGQFNALPNINLAIMFNWKEIRILNQLNNQRTLHLTAFAISTTTWN